MRGSATPTRSAASSRVARRCGSPLGSMTIAGWPARMWASAIAAWVTVLPAPVAPVIRAWTPRRGRRGRGRRRRGGRRRSPGARFQAIALGARAAAQRGGEAQRAASVALRGGLLSAVLDRFGVSAGAVPEGGGGGDREDEAELPVGEPEQVGERRAEEGPAPAQAAALQGAEDEEADERAGEQGPGERPEVGAETEGDVALAAGSSGRNRLEDVDRARRGSSRLPARPRGGSGRARSSSGRSATHSLGARRG